MNSCFGRLGLFSAVERQNFRIEEVLDFGFDDLLGLEGHLAFDLRILDDALDLLDVLRALRLVAVFGGGVVEDVVFEVVLVGEFAAFLLDDVVL